MVLVSKPAVLSFVEQHVISKDNEVNLYNIIMGLDKRTTFMIRNIPNKYTQ